MNIIMKAALMHEARDVPIKDPSQPELRVG